MHYIGNTKGRLVRPSTISNLGLPLLDGIHCLSYSHHAAQMQLGQLFHATPCPHTFLATYQRAAILTTDRAVARRLHNVAAI